jgi:hypothetical protein
MLAFKLGETIDELRIHGVKYAMKSASLMAFPTGWKNSSTDRAVQVCVREFAACAHEFTQLGAKLRGGS